MGNVLVLGNGFDLHHKKQTQYSDFLRFMKELKMNFANLEPSIKNDINDLNIMPFNESSLYSFFIHQYETMEEKNNWIDMEGELKRLIHKLIGFITAANNYNVDGHVWGKQAYMLKRETIEYEIVFTTLKSVFDVNDSGIFIVKDKYIDSWGKIDQDIVLEQLSDELSQIERLLWYYLAVAEPKRHDSIVRYKDLDSQLNPDYIVSFNYTNTYEKLYDAEKKKICYIHGSIKDMNSIVLGYDDLDERLDDIMFKKYYRRLMQRTDIIDNDKLNDQDGYGVMHHKPVIFFGHSLDISDEDVLKRFFENHAQKEIYVLDKSDRAKKTANLIKLIGKDSVVKKIQSGEIAFKEISPI